MDNGNSPNQIPQEAFALVDCRYLPGSQPEEIIESVKKIVKDPEIQIIVEKQGARQYATTPEFFYDELAKSIQKTFPNAVAMPILFPASNDNSYFRASGTPVYGLIPMMLSTEQIRSIHNKDEYIDVEDIEKGAQVFENFLQSVLFPKPSIDSAQVKRQR
jgi:acetylornithine deacetylase/succinyl-diaminopimelate desuccinylase-like protein